MPWTRELQVKYLIALPWTVTLDRDDEGDIVAEVAELPFLTASGASEKAVALDLYEALWTALDAMLEHQDSIPAPRGASLPWELGEEPPRRYERHMHTVALNGLEWADPAASTSSQPLALVA